MLSGIFMHSGLLTYSMTRAEVGSIVRFSDFQVLIDIHLRMAIIID